MQRVVRSFAAASMLSLVVAGTALGSHCINESKQSGAGQKASVIINTATGAVAFQGLHNGRLTGGFIDVWLDVNGDGAGDVLACDDAFLVSNHSPNGAASGQQEGEEGEPATLPVIIRGDDPGGAGNGIGSC